MKFSAIANGHTKARNGGALRSRAYQLEMFEESLKQNTIVVMSTGSGKTHVAALRIKSELEATRPRKLVWFLTPTVELCKQQHQDLQLQIPFASISQLTSHNNVQMWRRSTWDSALADVDIVVSTYEVLNGALCHAFVTMDSLALLVFDEVHNCTGKSPGSKVMRDFYHRNKEAGRAVPHILGLTANAASSPKQLRQVEALLDSVCRSPHIQKAEFLSHVNRPEVERLGFKSEEECDIQPSASLQQLRRLQQRLNANEPYAQSQVKALCGTSERMESELGSWAADEYIRLVVQSISGATKPCSTCLPQWEDPDKRYLADALRSVDLPRRMTPELSSTATSNKFRALICFLEQCPGTTTGILFAKERATVRMLFRLLTHHVDICKLFRVGIIVGQSNSPKKKREICDAWDVEGHSEDLDLFRRGKINLLIATSVLEEGIDVPQCNLVVCFDEPARLTTYVQRRGRARMHGSRYIILLDEGTEADRRDWDRLEEIMQQEYEAADREIGKLPGLEAVDGLRERQIRAEGTDALLDLETAKAHLQHFCSQLSSRYQSEARPEYIIEKEQTDDILDEEAVFGARVVLPASVPRHLRFAHSKELWQSPKFATKDAALEACRALYEAGLLDDSFLPLRFTDVMEEVSRIDAIIEIKEQYAPWPEVARAWKNEESLYKQGLILSDDQKTTLCEVEMYIPIPCSTLGSFPVYWNDTVVWRVEVSRPENVKLSDSARFATTTLLRAAYGHRWETEDRKHVVNFVAPGMLSLLSERSTAQDSCEQNTDKLIYLLRDVQDRNRPYFPEVLSSKPPKLLTPTSLAPGVIPADEQSNVLLRPWPRRCDFLHRPPPPAPKERPQTVALPRYQLKRDTLPAVYAKFGLLVPSIIHTVEVHLVLAKLQQTLFADVQIAQIGLLLPAICTPCAREQYNYQVFEFFGDSVLKFIASLFLMAKYPHYHEGYLSRKRAFIVSNLRLCNAALACGLDEFILTKPFTGKGWRPLYVDALYGADTNHQEHIRKISRKTVADVVEALIGGGWKIGGYTAALSIAKVFLPEINMPSLDDARKRLLVAEDDDGSCSERLRQLQQLLGYSFKKTSLLAQAMTHCSATTSPASYDRLEFLGDAILEMVVMNELAQYESRLPPTSLHSYREALVNRDYLGFLALEWSISQKRTVVSMDDAGRRTEKAQSEHRLCLGDFMHHGSDQVSQEQRAAIDRHAELQREVVSELETGKRYPWVLLASLHVNKFFADLIESVLAAVWVDSGSMLACREVAVKMGLIGHLHRMVRDNVQAMHPKEELHILTGKDEAEFKVHEMEDGGQRWSCSIYIKERLVAESVGCKSANEAKVRASEIAVSALRAGGNLRHRESLAVR